MLAKNNMNCKNSYIGYFSCFSNQIPEKTQAKEGSVYLAYSFRGCTLSNQGRHRGLSLRQWSHCTFSQEAEIDDGFRIGSEM